MNSIDVIVPCYGYAAFLRECVESILQQEGVHARVLIINDASPDDTEAVAAALAAESSNVFVRTHERNQGHISTYNEGIEWVRAPAYLLISADDFLLPGALHRATAALASDGRCAFVFGDVLELDTGGRTRLHRTVSDVPESPCPRTFGGLEFAALGRARNVVRTPSVVVRTALQKTVGGYRSDLPHAGDMEMWLRLSATGSVAYVPKPQAVYRLHGSNMSADYSRRLLFSEVSQRKLALDLFFEALGLSNPEAPRLQAAIMRELSHDAVGFASAMFNRGALEDVRQLSDFACAVYPEVVFSWPWAKLALKRRIGLRSWCQLKAAFQAGVRWDE